MKPQERLSSSSRKWMRTSFLRTLCSDSPVPLSTNASLGTGGLCLSTRARFRVKESGPVTAIQGEIKIGSVMRKLRITITMTRPAQQYSIYEDHPRASKEHKPQ